MRPSPYIFVDSTAYRSHSDISQRGQNDLFGVFSSLTATLHFVTKPIAESLVDRTGTLLDALPPETKRQLEDLRLAESSDRSQRTEAFSRLEDASSLDNEPTMVLLPGSYCNMGCSYCGQEHRRGTLHGNHREAVRRRVINKISRDDTRGIHVRWFGAEPLMAYAVIRDLARTFVDAAKESEVAYDSNIVTNGALLDERKMQTLINECLVTEYHITLDGWGARHDQHRPLKSGQSSFQRIIDKVLKAAATYQSARFILRTNVDVNNSEHVSEYLSNMARVGFARRRNVLFQLTPVRSWSNDVSAIELGMKRYAELETRWLTEMAELGLSTLTLPTKPKSRPCSAVNLDSDVIAADGAIYSCTEHPLVPVLELTKRIASVDTIDMSLPRPRGEFDDWYREVRDGLYPCHSCWLMPSCGGSCPKSWHEGLPPCPSLKFTMPTRIMIEATHRGYASA